MLLERPTKKTEIINFKITTSLLAFDILQYSPAMTDNEYSSDEVETFMRELNKKITSLSSYKKLRFLNQHFSVFLFSQLIVLWVSQTCYETSFTVPLILTGIMGLKVSFYAYFSMKFDEDVNKITKEHIEENKLDSPETKGANKIWKWNCNGRNLSLQRKKYGNVSPSIQPKENIDFLRFRLNTGDLTFDTSKFKSNFELWSGDRISTEQCNDFLSKIISIIKKENLYKYVNILISFFSILIYSMSGFFYYSRTFLTRDEWENHPYKSVFYSCLWTILALILWFFRFISNRAEKVQSKIIQEVVKENKVLQTRSFRWFSIVEVWGSTYLELWKDDRFFVDDSFIEL